MKQKDENSYRSIIRGTSIFGGVQVFQVIINLIRGKFVAMLLGPEGMGIAALFNTSANTIQRFASLGLNQAIVKEVAANSESEEGFRVTFSVARKLIVATSLLGALICILFSTPLSRLTFGDDSMSIPFMGLGVAVGLTIAFMGKSALLQGMHEVKRLSMASIVGALTGLLVGVPLYYFFGTQGIVPAIAAYALAMYIFYSISLKKATDAPGMKFDFRTHAPIAKKLVILGSILMANELFFSLAQYLLNIFVKGQGSTAEVGLYQAANSVTNQYAGLVFAAMAMDYFPRLSKVAADNVRMRDVVNRQSEIISLIIAPAVILLILTSPLVIRILLTREYLPIMPLMRWMGLGVLLKALMYPMAYISFAKGNKKLFFWLEGVFCNCLTLLLSCTGFYFFGLIGLGYALVADNFICIIVYYCVNRRLYGYRFSKRALHGMTGAVFMASTAFASCLIPNHILSYSLMTVIFIASAAVCFSMLRKRLSATTPED